ncbi:MAG: hypothetical protein V1660_02810 [archaeon]
MKKQTTFAIMIIAALMAMPTVLAGCCVIQNEKCTFWDLTCSNDDCKAKQQSFCENLDDWGYASATTWYDGTCDTITIPQTCDNGFDIPEFSTIAAGLALAGSTIGFIIIARRKK